MNVAIWPICGVLIPSVRMMNAVRLNVVAPSYSPRKIYCQKFCKHTLKFSSTKKYKKEFKKLYQFLGEILKYYETI
jgi:hypothetical protein